MVEGSEEFLGGFAGGFLARAGVIGYGIYATTKRVFVVNLRKTDPRHFLGGAMAGFVQGQLMPKLSTDESDRVIQELEGKKELDVDKGQIARIDLKSLGLFTKGDIVITPKTGEHIRVKLLHKIAFERLRELIQVFYPEVLSVA